MKTADHEHTAGTVIFEPLQHKASRPAEPRHRDKDTLCHSWPRLLNVDLAAEYIGVSKWTLIEILNAGDVRTVPLPRPRTAKAMKTKPAGDTMRRKLVDRLDLDALVDRWKANA